MTPTTPLRQVNQNAERKHILSTVYDFLFSLVEELEEQPTQPDTPSKEEEITKPIQIQANQVNE